MSILEQCWQIIFDMFINNRDRHFGNILIIADKHKSMKKYLLIDHSLAFNGLNWKEGQTRPTLPYSMTIIPWKLDGITLAQFRRAAMQMCMLTVEVMNRLLERLPNSWNIDEYDAAIKYSLTHRNEKLIMNMIMANNEIQNALPTRGEM